MPLFAFHFTVSAFAKQNLSDFAHFDNFFFCFSSEIQLQTPSRVHLIHTKSYSMQHSPQTFKPNKQTHFSQIFFGQFGMRNFQMAYN